MQLTKNTWHYNFYKWIYGKYEEPNNNFCDYFWSLVLAILTLPFTWIGALLAKKLDLIDYSGRFGTTVLIELLTLGTICGYYSNWLKALIVTSAILGFFLVLFLILYGNDNGWYDGIKENNQKLSNNISEIKNISKEGWKSFKGKYCPKIDWK